MLKGKLSIDERLEMNERSVMDTRAKLKRLLKTRKGLMQKKQETEERAYTIRMGNAVREILGDDLNEESLKAFLFSTLKEELEDGELSGLLEMDEGIGNEPVPAFGPGGEEKIS